jgi:hypothetical protein
MERLWSFAIVAVVFLAVGAAGVLAYQSLTKSKAGLPVAATPSPQPVSGTEPVATSPEPKAAESLNPSSGGGSVSGGSDKFTILETQKLSADRYTVQTGETVNFFTKLKNTGTSKKFLTHICFQYSGGNFGCQLNMNLDPQEEKAIHNSMVFPNPGTYSVWVIWSQDKANFYPPVSAGSVTVTVY